MRGAASARAGAVAWRSPVRTTGLAAAGGLLSILLGAGFALAAYRFGPLVALGGVLAAAAIPVIAAWPIAGVCAALLVIPLEYLAAETAAGFGISPAEALLLLTAAVSSPRLAFELAPRDVHPAFYAFGALILISALGVLFAIDVFAVARITVMWAGILVAAVLVATSGERELRAVLLCLAAVGGILGALAVTGLQEQETVAGGAIVINRAQATFSHPTALAFVLVMTFPAAAALALQRRGAARIALLACAGFAVTGLLLTHTRGAILGGALAVLVLASWAPFRRLAAVVLAALVAAAALNIGELTSAQPVTVVTERVSTIASLKTHRDDRLEIWAETPGMIAQYPLLGAGQGNFPAISTDFGLADIGGLPFDHAHNLFLNLAVELGLGALALFLVFLYQVARAGRRALRAKSRRFYPLALALSASLLGLLLNSITEYPFRNNVIMAMILVDIGLLIGLERLSRTAGPPAARGATGA